MLTAAIKCGAVILGDSFHRFSPQGVSGVVVIAESHLSVHTWPEYGYAAVDVFTCGTTVDPAAEVSSKARLKNHNRRLKESGLRRIRIFMDDPRYWLAKNKQTVQAPP
jgi:S-adenosylmethionine decarboxylase proenzyme